MKSARRPQRRSSSSSHGSSSRSMNVNTRSSTSRARYSSTPHPRRISSQPDTAASQHSAISRNTSRSAASSSNPLSQSVHESTASGRRSRAASSLWGSDCHEVICAVTESRGISPSIGFAFVNVTTNEVLLGQICDNQFYNKTVYKVQLYDPSTILMVNTAFGPNQKSKLLEVLQGACQVQIEAYDRRYWSENAGLEFIQMLAFMEDVEAIKVAIQGNFYATCSFAAAIHFVQYSCRISIMPHSLRVKYQPSEDTMMIDISTIQSLELIQNVQDPKSRDCLFGLMNETLTPMGSRFLRSCILQPSTQIKNTLSLRYDALQELTMKEEMFFEIRKALKKFTDVEKLLTRLVLVPEQSSIYASEQAINYILSIKAFVIAIPQVRSALEPAQSQLLCRARDLCQPELTQPVLDLIATVINEDVTTAKKPLDMRNQRAYAVKSGVHGLLDVARQTYKEATDDAYQSIDDLQSSHNLSAEVKYDDKRQFYIRLRYSDFEDRPLPDVFINRFRKGVWIECQTVGLVKLNNRIVDSYNEAIMLSDKVVKDLLREILRHTPNLFRTCEGIALLDMVASFGQSATTRDYIRPEFTSNLALRGARHPIHERLNPERFVPNDVFASEQNRFQIITGCNMSGKSTYIRMIAMLQVMAQVGSFVPAQYAEFRIIQQLFVRLSTDDSIEANMSTFSIEMREIAFILRNINEHGLAIIDELGRGTSTRDGLAIALAVSEALLQSNAYIWFATHFHQLPKILGSQPGVLNLHLATEFSNAQGYSPKMTMLYKISSGPVKERNYGISLARAIGLPDDFIEIAEQVSMTLTEEFERNKHDAESTKVVQRRRLILSLNETLSHLQTSEMDDITLGNYLKRVQDEFVFRMEAIDRQQYSEATSIVEEIE